MRCGFSDPAAALRDIDDALKNAREIGQSATLMWALHYTAVPLILCGDYSRANALAQELGALADETDAPFWKVNGSLDHGSLLAVIGDASDAPEHLIKSIGCVHRGTTLAAHSTLHHCG
jgi:hypothetical protein